MTSLKLREYSKSNLIPLSIYANAHVFSAEYAEKSVSVDRNFMDNERMKYSENSKTCIITCSGNLQSMGKVLSANNETLDVLQYLHTDLIGHSVNSIMPNVLADIHDDLMKNYFETNTGRVMGRERLVF